MKIYIFRHAQKEIDFTANPDLNQQGHAQAEVLLQKVLKNELPCPTQLWVSPKRRTQSTFGPLAEHLKLKLKIHEGLLEQVAAENISDFHKRIKGLIEEMTATPHEIIFMCTHYDWLIEVLNILPSDQDFSESKFSHWSSGQHIGFELDEDGLFKFIGVYYLK